MNKVLTLKTRLKDLGFTAVIKEHSYFTNAVWITFHPLDAILIKLDEAEEYLRHVHANDFESIYNGLKMLEIKKSRNSAKKYWEIEE